MVAEITCCCKGEPAVAKVVDAAVASTKLADAEEAVAVERRVVAVAAEARCCCEGVRALPAAAGPALSLGLIYLTTLWYFISSETRAARRAAGWRPYPNGSMLGVLGGVYTRGYAAKRRRLASASG